MAMTFSTICDFFDGSPNQILAFYYAGNNMGRSVSKQDVPTSPHPTSEPVLLLKSNCTKAHGWINEFW